MPTAKQQAANRQNTQKSTGPKTPEGKVVVALNVMKHGLLSRHMLCQMKTRRRWSSWGSGCVPSCNRLASSRCGWWIAS